MKKELMKKMMRTHGSFLKAITKAAEDVDDMEDSPASEGIKAETKKPSLKKKTLILAFMKKHKAKKVK